MRQTYLALLFILSFTAQGNSIFSASKREGLLIWLGDVFDPKITESMISNSAVTAYKCLQNGCVLKKDAPLLLKGVPSIVGKMISIDNKVDFSKDDQTVFLFFNFEKIDDRIFVDSVLTAQGFYPNMIKASAIAEIRRGKPVFVMRFKAKLLPGDDAPFIPRYFHMSQNHQSFRKKPEDYKISTNSPKEQSSQDPLESLTCLELSDEDNEEKMVASPAQHQITLKSEKPSASKTLKIFGKERTILFKNIPSKNDDSIIKKIEISKTYQINRFFLSQDTEFLYSCTDRVFAINTAHLI